MLQPEIIEFLASTTPQILAKNIPVTENRESKRHDIQQKAEAGEEKAVSPFEFRPQRLRFAVEDEYFEDGDINRHMYLQNIVTSFVDDKQPPTISEFRCHIAGCKQLFDTLEGYEHHYNALHRNVCSNCKRSFPSNRLLEIHILEWHDSLFQIMAEKQCMYECLVEGCGLKFKTSKERKDHLIRTHSYPADFRFDKSKKIGRTTEKKTQQKKDAHMEVSATVLQQESSESMDFSLTPEPVETEPMQAANLKPRYSYKVPSSICFGQGSVRGFRGRRKK
ncbi:zinc finger protein 511 [Danio rerio]|uniref:Zinc finger protein 511 n=1 Tax=Danio rerio TaxID=7955 RepID=ZN511_DANRE|nr:zinc finger protein 511 [Danio rerio]Q7ZZ00.1 RecName: Full=Zinc finger protein 511 [Danio rerio]|eukprot:NP_001004531.1 zinc finger protein 511 [Danio rerio]